MNVEKPGFATVAQAYAKTRLDTEEKTRPVEASDEKTQPAAQPAGAEGRQDVVAIGAAEEDTQLQKWQELLEQLREAPNKLEMKTSAPKDGSSRLTQRLVSAVSQFEVRSVITKASTELMNARIAASLATGDDKKKAQAIVRRLEKVIDRATRKISDLQGEENLQRQVNQAQKAKQRQRADELKGELRAQKRRRQERERRYLQEAGENDRNDAMEGLGQGQPSAQTEMDPASEAEIAAKAEAIAAMEVAVESAAGGGDAGAGGEAAATPAGQAGGDAAGAAVAAEGGGEVAAE